jgi:hypothetical protein
MRLGRGLTPVLLTLARRHGVGLVTFDASLANLGRGDGVELLRA